MEDREIGRGIAAYDFGEATGTVRRFSEPQDVIDAFGSDLEHTIALVQAGGTTFLSPILGQLRGIICMTGSTRSHLAIVSREFQVPCVLQVDLDEELADGDLLRMSAIDADNGRILRVTSDALAGDAA